MTKKIFLIFLSPSISSPFPVFFLYFKLICTSFSWPPVMRFCNHFCSSLHSLNCFSRQFSFFLPPNFLSLFKCQLFLLLFRSKHSRKEIFFVCSKKRMKRKMMMTSTHKLDSIHWLASLLFSVLHSNKEPGITFFFSFLPPTTRLEQLTKLRLEKIKVLTERCMERCEWGEREREFLRDKERKRE